MWKYCSRAEVSAFSGLSEDVMADTWSEMTEGLINEHTGNIYGETTTYTV